MAEVHTLPGGCTTPAPPAVEPAPLTAVKGWDCDTGDEAPVIVNPNATSEGLQWWALGQLSQANKLLTMLSCSEKGYSAAELADAIRHFTEQAEQVLKAAVMKPLESRDA